MSNFSWFINHDLQIMIFKMRQLVWLINNDLEIFIAC